jgi:hypothetical protein
MCFVDLRLTQHRYQTHVSGMIDTDQANGRGTSDSDDDDDDGEEGASSASSAPVVVLVTNDRGNLDKAKDDAIFSFTGSFSTRRCFQGPDEPPVLDYAAAYKPDTVDILAQAADPMQEAAEKDDKSEQTYTEYLLPSAIQRGIKNGRLYQGVYHASRSANVCMCGCGAHARQRQHARWLCDQPQSRAVCAPQGWSPGFSISIDDL